jgi:hypothetical protein
MSNAEHYPTNLPVPNAPLEPVGYVLGVQFHEPLKLIRQRGMEFGAKLATYFDARGVDLQDRSWTFSQPLGDSAAGLFRVVIHEQAVSLEARAPTNTLEWFEHRYEFILNEFQEAFKPALLISSNAKVLATIQIDGDARNFLLEHVAHMPIEKLNSLRRPIHIIGLRLAMPAFEVQEEPAPKPKAGKRKGKPKKAKIIESVEWAADVKAESLAVDTGKLYLEATGIWPPGPRIWDNEATKEAVTRLATVKAYLADRFVPFLNDSN